MSIPKIIHYCWFGPNPIPKNEQIYIENWQVKLPEYRFVFWNEESFDVQSVRYVKQAYDQGKYAFVSDYVRIYALNKYGGIYLDTDVEVLKDFSPFLDHNTFLGFENRTMVGTGIIGTQKNNPLFLKLLRYYNSHDFINKNGVADTTTNVKILNKIIYIFLTIFLYLLKCPQSLILSALRAFCFCGKPHISRSIFLYFRYQSWLKSW